MKKIVNNILRKFGVALIRLPKYFFSGQRFTPVEKNFHGKKIHIHDIASFNLCYQEIFEGDMYNFKAKTNAPYIIDCGANMGMSVIYFKELYPDAHVLAFEADSHIFNFLEKNIKSFGLTNVQLVNKAVWDQDTILSFLAEGGAGGRIESDGTDGNQYKKVTAVRLRSYLAERHIDFLKIDIEGAEDIVIRDCKALLSNVDNIFIEYHSKPGDSQTLHEILDIVQKAGFRYHIKDAYTTSHPYISRELNFGMDLQLNIFCYKGE